MGKQARAHDMVGWHDEKTPRKVNLLGRLASLGESRRGDDNKVAPRRRQGIPNRQGFGEGNGIVDEVKEAAPELSRLCLELFRW